MSEQEHPLCPIAALFEADVFDANRLWPQTSPFAPGDDGRYYAERDVECQAWKYELGPWLGCGDEQDHEAEVSGCVDACFTHKGPYQRLHGRKCAKRFGPRSARQPQ